MERRQTPDAPPHLPGRTSPADTWWMLVAVAAIPTGVITLFLMYAS